MPNYEIITNIVNSFELFVHITSNTVIYLHNMYTNTISIKTYLLKWKTLPFFHLKSILSTTIKVLKVLYLIKKNKNPRK